MVWFRRKSTSKIPTGNPYHPPYYYYTPALPMYPTSGNYSHSNFTHSSVPYYTRSYADYAPQDSLNPLLRLYRDTTSTCIKWDTRLPPSSALSSIERDRTISLSEVRMEAVRPKRSGVRIIFEHHPEWYIDVLPLSRNYLLIEDVLLAIFNFLQRHVSLRAWGMLKDGVQKRAHMARYERLAKGPVEYETDSKVKYVDLLGSHTLFGGLRVIGPDEWSVTLLKRRDGL
ncbi:hypothetical protein BU17DRAFT_91169 [Hysterangium stoloniferum]|nr:hypothetical protein BU17DRAFT_91169 [Hysterangium stoloniferum]